MNAPRLVLLLLTLQLLGSACSRNDPEYEPVPARLIRIGVVLTSGTETAAGLEYVTAIELARQDIHACLVQAGIADRVVCDIRVTGGDADTAAASLRTFSRQGIRIVIAACGMAELRALRDLADSLDVLIVSPSSSGSSMAQPGDHLYRLITPDAIEAGAMNKMLTEDKVRVIVPVVCDQPEHLDLAAAMGSVFTAGGGIVLAPVIYPPLLTGFGDILLQLETAVSEQFLHHNPNEVAVYLVSGREGTRLLAEAKPYPALNNVYWYGGSGFTGNQDVLSDTVAALFTYTHGLPCPIPAADDDALPLWQPVHDRLVQGTGREPYITAFNAYDALWVAVRSLRTATDETMETLKPVFIAEAARYFGVTGNLRLDANGDRAAGSYDFWSVKYDTAGYAWKRIARYNSRDNSLVRLTD